MENLADYKITIQSLIVQNTILASNLETLKDQFLELVGHENSEFMQKKIKKILEEKFSKNRAESIKAFMIKNDIPESEYERWKSIVE